MKTRYEAKKVALGRKWNRFERERKERGEVTTAVLLMPIALLVVLIVVQAALVFHGQAIINTAAQDGAKAVQNTGSSEADARSMAQSVISANAGDLLSDVNIEVHTGRTQVAVTVDAGVKSLVPGYRPTISSTATMPREVFVPENQR